MSYYGDRHGESSIVEAFTLPPLPYPVILILLMVTLLLGVSWFFTYEDFIEEASQQLSWALLVVPIALVLLIRWISIPLPSSFPPLAPPAAQSKKGKQGENILGFNRSTAMEFDQPPPRWRLLAATLSPDKASVDAAAVGLDALAADTRYPSP